MWPKIRLIYKRVMTYEYAPRYARLAGDISIYEPQFQKRIIETKSEKEPWALQGQAQIDNAKKFLREYKIDEGWKSLHSAKRNEIFGMKKTERLALANSLFKEAEKLNEWRKDAIIEMLGSKKNGVTETPDAEVLVMAAELKDEDYNNMYYMNRLSRNIFWLLSGLLFLVLSAIVIYFSVCLKVYDCNFNKDLSLNGYLIGVLLFGFLGALTSAILFTRNLTRSSRIKELTSSQVVVMSKIFIGAGFSIFIFLLLKSSIAESIKLFSFSISQPLDYFAIAFASGFTERLAQKSMDLIVGKDKNEKVKTSSPSVV